MYSTTEVKLPYTKPIHSHGKLCQGMVRDKEGSLWARFGFMQCFSDGNFHDA